jgi:hypothetical protein
MRDIYYIGCYGGDTLKHRSVENCNLAGTMKMRYIVGLLKKMGYRVIVLSLTTDLVAGFHPMEELIIDEQEIHIYIPYFLIRIAGKSRGQKTAVFFLKNYLKRKLSNNSIVISYHSLLYGDMLTKLHRNTRFRWIPQIEEIYCLSRGELQNPRFLKKEERMFTEGDGFLFVNDLLPYKYANGKNYAVSYGNYHIYPGQPVINKKNINLVYTGIINTDRGAFLLLDSMKYLPFNYHLNVLGFGTENNIRQFMTKLEELNSIFGERRIAFYGTKTGDEYSQFLLQNQIGISLMDETEAISLNAFPSKIMTYLGHSLYVVSSKTKSISASKVADILYFCDNKPKSVADAILSVPLETNYLAKQKLEELEEIFIEEFRKVLES